MENNDDFKDTRPNSSTPEIPPLNIPNDLNLGQALSVLADYAVSDLLKEEMNTALVASFGSTDAWDRMNDKDRVSFLEYFVFDRPHSKWNMSPSRLFAESAVGLSDGLRAKFLRIADASIDFYIVKKSIEGSVTLLSIGNGGTSVVYDRRLGGTLKVGELLQARVLNWDDTLSFSGFVKLYQRNSEAFARQLVKTREQTSEENWYQEMRNIPHVLTAKMKKHADDSMRTELSNMSDEMTQEEYVKAINAALKTRNLEQAHSYATEFAQIEPNNEIALFLLASVSLHSNMVAEAASGFEKLLSLNPNHISARMNLAVARMMENRHEDALREYQQCLISTTDEKLLPAILAGIGYIACLLGDKVQGEMAFDKAVKLANGDFMMLSAIATNMIQVSQYQRATKVLKQMIALQPENATPHHSLGDVYSKLEKHSSAAKSYSRAYDLDKENSLLLKKLGYAYMKLEKYDKAIEALGMYCSVFPGDYEAHNNIGVLLQFVKQVKSAEEAFLRALALKSDYLSPMLNLTKLYTQLGRLNEAEKYLGKASSLAPDNPIAIELSHILEEERRRRQARGDK